MTVYFQTKSKEQRNYILTGIEGIGKIYFERGGVYGTEDKEEIKALLSHPCYRRGDYYLATNDELVDKYLSGDTPDTLTEDILDTLSLQGIRELGELLGCKNDKPSLIKYEIVGSPITTPVQHILDYYQVSENVPMPEVKEKEEGNETKVEEFQVKTSTDYNVRDALNLVKDMSKEELKIFLAEDDERKTIINEVNRLLEE